MGEVWNPWHGCIKYSEGCANCYVYRRDALYGKDSSVVERTSSFRLPVRLGRNGQPKLPGGTHVYACMTSDFFLEQADAWRAEAWEMIRMRSDIRFTIITKRILRAAQCLPEDWGEGYPNVEIGLTCENPKRAEERLDTFLSLPIQRKFIICEPLLGEMDLSRWLDSRIAQVVAGGESGERARPMDYNWVLKLRAQCAAAGVSFHFKQTGARFIKDGRLYRIARKEQMRQARRANIDL